MRRFTFLAAAIPIAHAATLADVCTTSYVQASLPADGFYNGITIDASSVTASPVYNSSISGSVMYPDGTIDGFCNVTMAYTHNGRDDQVLLNYWLPAPANFKNRYLATGGGGLAINSGLTTSGSLPGGLLYGAVAGLTDGGFGSFTDEADANFLLANGTINWENVFMFGYEAIHEMSVIGKDFTKLFFNMNGATNSSTNSTQKLYSYYQACSEGGREGWSQVQRYGDQYDGAVIGAPALRYYFQQIQHLYSNVVEQTLGYYPSPCELEKIMNLTITACDPMDGKTDGVVARSDLCKLNFNINTTIGEPYYCAASSGSSPFGKRQFGGGSSTPVQNGTVSAQGVAVAAKIIDGLKTTDGKRVYFSYQPASTFTDAQTQYNADTDEWELSISGLGAEFVTRYLELQNTSTLTSLDGVTYDTLKDWMIEGWQKYEDTLQTTWPDLTPFYEAGGKVLHYHGESDYSIPTASSIRYHESVRQIMYPSLSFNDSQTALGDWYRLFLVPGAGHCSTNEYEPNGPFPQTNLAVMIDWVENGVQPTTLNATYLAGVDEGQNAQICAWPLRPYWVNNGTTMECQYDQTSIDSWIYDLDAIKMPVY